MQPLDTPISMLMSTEDLVVVGPDQSLADVWDLMTGNDIQHVPVIVGDELVGLVSSSDVGRAVIEGRVGRLEDTAVSQVMENKLVRLHPKASLREAAMLLAEGGFHSLPVADDENLLVGILTTTDVIRHIVNG